MNHNRSELKVKLIKWKKNLTFSGYYRRQTLHSIFKILIKIIQILLMNSTQYYLLVSDMSKNQCSLLLKKTKAFGKYDIIKCKWLSIMS
jgi:hypothetical protein